MALIACPECTKDVSTNAPSCPHCGNPIVGAMATATNAVKCHRKARGWLALIVISFVLISPILLLYNATNTLTHSSELSEIYPVGWKGAWLILMLFHTPIVIYGVVAGILLWRLSPTALVHSRRYLKLKLAYGIVLPTILWPVPTLPENELRFYMAYAFSVFWYTTYFVTVWVYLKRSKKVRAIYHDGKAD